MELTDKVDSAMSASRVWDVLAAARASYRSEVSPHYDEVFWEVAGRVEVAGCLGKADIAALMVWKRLSARTRWVTDLMSLPDVAVRMATAEAVRAVRGTETSRGQAAGAGRAALVDLPGFHKGDALASAVLTAAAPARMAVYDRRVQQALDSLDLTLTATPGRYGRYMSLLEQLLEQGGHQAEGWTCRDLDTALYWIGGSWPTT
ncbi:hypothetical protein [Streptomyces sp. NBC_00448]|uniref:hypothetical protein n=1 Tax=Streptomyces sp. NBC_00448 TaxID=2903652 RepID=UPI002E205ACF